MFSIEVVDFLSATNTIIHRWTAAAGRRRTRCSEQLSPRNGFSETKLFSSFDHVQISNETRNRRSILFYCVSNRPPSHGGDVHPA